MRHSIGTFGRPVLQAATTGEIWSITILGSYRLPVPFHRFFIPNTKLTITLDQDTSSPGVLDVVMLFADQSAPDSQMLALKPISVWIIVYISAPTSMARLESTIYGIDTTVIVIRTCKTGCRFHCLPVCWAWNRGLDGRWACHRLKGVNSSNVANKNLNIKKWTNRIQCRPKKKSLIQKYWPLS